MRPTPPPPRWAQGYRLRDLVLVSLLVSSLLSWGAAACANDSGPERPLANPDPAPSPALERFTQEPIIVTAPSLAEEARRQPASVTVFSAKTLEAAGIETTADLRSKAPNLVVQEAGDRRSNAFAIRGLGTTLGAGTSVGLYVDGVPYADQRAALIPLFDVEAVEVVRGPQNLRFGRSADGGAIAVHTAGPPAEPSAHASIQYGNFDTQIYEAAAGGPVVPDRLYASVAGLSSRRAGYIENTFLDQGLDDRDLLAGRGKLLLAPTPELEIELTGEVQHADEGTRGFVSRAEPDPYRIAYDVPGSERTDTALAALRAEYEGPSFHVTSRTARRTFIADHSRFDLDLTPQDLLVLIDDYDNVDWSQELRMASPDPAGPWRWLLGGFFEDAVTSPQLAVQVDDTGLVQAPPPAGFGLPFTAPVTDRQRGRIHAQTFAAFGEVATTALAPLELRAGLRYQHDDVGMRRSHVLNAPVDGATAPVSPPFDLTTSSSAWLPQLALAYRLRRRSLRPILFYVAVARGYRSAGFSHLIDDPTLARFAPQRDWSWETGLKSTWLDDRLSADLALFYVLAEDFQVARRAGFTSFRILNAEQVTTRGVEAALAARPCAGLEIDTAIGYTDARYDDFQLPDRGPRLDGNAVALVPPYDFSIALQYRHPRGLWTRIDYHGVGAYEFTEDNSGGQGAYQLLDAHFGWTGAHWGASVYGRNLTDATYFPFALPDGPGGEFIVTPAAPRTFGMAVTATF
jgi:iron complex outermembrane recepter protein